MEEKKLFKGLYYAFLDAIRKIQWAALVGLVCLFGTFIIVNETFVPQYTSSTTYIIKSKSSGNNAYTTLVAAEKLMDAFDVVLNSKELSSIILSDTGWKEIPGTISSQQISDTNILLVSVSADTPKSAYMYMREINDKGILIMKNIADDAVITVFRQPTVPLTASNSPGAKSKSIKVALLGAVLTFAAFMAYSYFKNFINMPEQLKESNTVVVETLPYEGKLFSLLPMFKKDKSGHLINGIDCSFSYVEAIKNVRHKISKNDSGNTISTVISSATAGEGKSTVAANLALSIAQRGKKVALVDFDVYNPSQYKLFNGKNNVYNRVEDYIYSGDGYSDGIKVDPVTGILMFFGLPTIHARRIFPTESATRLIEYLKAYADYIIVDTPPISLFADASEITDFTDYALLVVREHHAMEDDIEDAIDIMKSGKAEFLGCVYNCARFTEETNTRYGYGYGYGYGKYKYGYSRYNHYGYGSDDDELPDEDSEEINAEEDGE